MHTFNLYTVIRLNLGIFLSVFSFGRRRSEGSRASLDFDVAVEERRGVGSDGDGFVEFAEIGENAVEGRSAFSEDDALVLRGSREEFVEGSRLRKEDEIGAVAFTYQANLRRRELSEHSFGGVCSDELRPIPFVRYRIQLCHLERRFKRRYTIVVCVRIPVVAHVIRPRAHVDSSGFELLNRCNTSPTRRVWNILIDENAHSICGTSAIL